MTVCAVSKEELDALVQGEQSTLAGAGLSLTGSTGPGDLPASLSVEAKQHLVHGTAALATGVMLERGASFLANILAARLGGAPVFGAYSLAISTSNNIATYAAGGIGATATRFSGKYPYGCGKYSTLARVLAVVALVSAFVAAAILCCGAGLIARILGKESLAPLLRWAAVSVVGIIVLECARGFFVGQRRNRALLLLSLLVGAGMLLFLPLMASTKSPSHMIVAQGCITAGAVLVSVLFARRLDLFEPGEARGGFAPMLREVWSFGFVQLAGLIGSNLAGLWLVTLIARSDKSLVQMSFFAIASQLRNLAGIAPGLMTEGSYAVMASPDAESRTPHRVLALCTYGSLGVALLLSCVGIVAAPWLVPLLYGQQYRGDVLTVAFALALAVVHMGNAPAAARLTIVSVRATGLINTVWAVFVAAVGTAVLLHHGTAWGATAVLLAAHLLSSVLVLVTLHRLDRVPPTIALAYGTGVFFSVGLALLALLRETYPAAALPLSLAMIGIATVGAGVLWMLGRRNCWLPSSASLRSALQAMFARLRRNQESAGTAGGSHV